MSNQGTSNTATSLLGPTDRKQKQSCSFDPISTN